MRARRAPRRSRAPTSAPPGRGGRTPWAVGSTPAGGSLPSASPRADHGGPQCRRPAPPTPDPPTTPPIRRNHPGTSPHHRPIPRAPSGEPAAASPGDPVLTPRADHLTRSRECLARMRDAGRPSRRRRRRRLRQRGTRRRPGPPAAGAGRRSVRPAVLRPDRPEPATSEQPTGETFHIGRRHVRDDAGDPLVIDWRAPMSRPFYRATADGSDGRPPPPALRLRRRRAHLLRGRAADRRLAGRGGGGREPHPAGGDRAPPRRPDARHRRHHPARPGRPGPRRARQTASACRARPGTGKTAVGLHRAAYLLYTYPDRLRRSGVLVVGPNRAFLGYIGQVLPALGEIGVTQSTVEELLAPVPVRATDPPEVATLKGDARMAEVLRRAVTRLVRRPDDGVVVVVGAPAATGSRPSGSAATSTTCAAARSTTTAARERLHLLLAEDVRRQREEAGGAPSDAETARVARSAAVRDFVGRGLAGARPGGAGASTCSPTPTGWPRRPAACSTRTSSERLRWDRPPRSVRSAPVVGGGRGARRRGRRPARPARLVRPCGARRGAGPLGRCSAAASPGAARPARSPCSVTSPRAPRRGPPRTGRITLNHLGKPDARIEPLTRGYRVPADVIALRQPAAAPPRRRPPAGHARSGRRPAACGCGAVATRPPRSPGRRWRRWRRRDRSA